MSQVKKYVIIGNGIAGLSAAKAIRKNDLEGDITIITSEHYLTYYRVKLSHYISKDFNDEELLMHDKKWYEERRINVLLGSVVKGIDSEKKCVALEGGKVIQYERLLLANGSAPFIPQMKGNTKEGVFTLRTLNDLKKIQHYLRKCNSITVLGGGVLGLEAAWAMKELGKVVNIVEFFPYLLPKQLDEEFSKNVSNALQEKGLNLYLGASAEEVIGKDAVEGLKLDNGITIETNAILISVGIRCNLDLVANTKIKYDKGICVDRYMRTNIPDIYAAGDIAEIDGRVVGLWGVSREQGKVAGENMSGGAIEYQLPELSTMLNIGDTSVFSIGNVREYDYSLEEVIERVPNKKSYYKLYATNNQVTGGIVINDISNNQNFKKAVTNKMGITEDMKKNLSIIDIVKSV